MSRHSIERASREVISWLTIARMSACVTVAVRIGRRPFRWRIGPASSSSFAEALEEGRVIVVGTEHEAELVDAVLGLRAQRGACRQGAVGPTLARRFQART